jgi:hypothetical protein
VTLTMATALLLDKYASNEVKDKFLNHVLSSGEVKLLKEQLFQPRDRADQMLGQILYVQLDATVFGGEWKRMVAELFIEYTWKKNEWLDSEMKSVKYFDKIVRMKF